MAEKLRRSASGIIENKLARYGAGFAALLLMFFVFRAITSSSSDESVQGATDQSSIELNEPLASQDVNKEITFPITDNSGAEVGEVLMVLEKAEVRDELIVKGKKAASVQGRVFLVLNLKVTNSFERAIEVNTRDYFRVAVGGDESEWLAPDIHNDPVKIQAISTKPTRVAFPVDAGVNTYVLQVGEIKGEKERVELNLE